MDARLARTSRLSSIVGVGDAKAMLERQNAKIAKSIMMKWDKSLARKEKKAKLYRFSTETPALKLFDILFPMLYLIRSATSFIDTCPLQELGIQPSDQITFYSSENLTEVALELASGRRK